MKRRIILLALVSSLTISLAACSDTEITINEPITKQKSLDVTVEEETSLPEEVVVFEVEEEIGKNKYNIYICYA